MRSSPQCRRAALFISLLLMYPALALADAADAFNFSVGATRMRDDNVFRLSPNANTQAVIGSSERGDTVLTQFFGSTFKQTFGRQQLELELNLNDSRYDRFHFLDYRGGNARANFDWRMTDMLGGSVGKSRTRSLYGFGEFRSPVQNILTSESEYASIRLTLDPAWQLETEARRNTAINGSALNRTSDSTTDIFTSGIRYTPSSGSYVLARVIQSEGDYPNLVYRSGSQIDNSYSQNDAGVEAYWNASGHSRIGASLNRTRREHRNVRERDFSGWTGGASLDWSVTAATTLTLRWRRDLGGSGSDPLSSYAITDSTQLRVSWAPSTKLMLSAQYELRDKTYSGDPIAALSALEKRHDNQEILSLTLNYQLDPSLLFSLGYTRDDRQSNYAGLPYMATMRNATLQFSF